ncbi:MAG: hypothetical protein IT531_10700 [Burkholderiales bacterium]|nr:hypothetical protein [Burkholderiales bacterium]
MASFYRNLSADEVATLDRLSRLLIELRENRERLLERHGAADEAALIARIRDGDIAEHPAYEDYLGAAIIAATREAIRADLKQYMLSIDTR